MRTAAVAVVAAVLAAAACSGPLGPEPTPSVVVTPGPTAEPSSAPTTRPSHVATPQPLPPPPATRVPAPAPTRVAPAPADPTPPDPPQPDPRHGVPDGWLGLDVERLPTSRTVVALTFDGGASATAVASILATLDRLDVPATFFVTGEFARSHPDAVRAMASAGHPVGNHSDTHPDFTVTTTAAIRAELAAAEASITALTGRAARPLFRFPYGARTALDITVVNQAGYVPFRWTVDTLGWKGTSGGMDADAVQRRVLDSLTPGQIVLMHVGAHPEDGSTLDADALPGIIDGVRSRGYGFVTLTEILR